MQHAIWVQMSRGHNHALETKPSATAVAAVLQSSCGTVVLNRTDFSLSPVIFPISLPNYPSSMWLTLTMWTFLLTTFVSEQL